MKIFCSVTYYAPYISGLTLYAQRLAEGLTNEHSVVVLSMKHESKLADIDKLAGVVVYRARPLFRVSKGFISLGWLVRAIIEIKKTDVVVLHLPQFESIFAAIFAKVLHKPCVTIYHCDLVIVPSISGSIIQFILDILHSVVLLLSNTIITNSESYARSSRILPKFRSKLVYHAPPIPCPPLNEKVVKHLRKTIGSSEILIGLVTRMAREKGIEYLLEGIPYLEKHISKSWKIVIAGPEKTVGEEDYRKKIQTLCRQYKERIVLLGLLSEDEKGALFSLLDVFVLPSVNSTESFGMTQVEAMYYGVPVVASDLPGVNIPVNFANGGIVVPPRNTLKLANATIMVLSNKKKYSINTRMLTDQFSTKSYIKYFNLLLQDL